MSRYENAPENAYKIMNKLIGDHFSYLAGSKIQILFDTKKKKRGGEYRIGSIQTTNDLTKFLTSDDEGEAADYIMYIDKLIWNLTEDRDKERIVYHELCHCDVNLEKTHPYKIKDHEIQGFYSELDFNNDDPKWKLRLSTIASSVYDEEE